MEDSPQNIQNIRPDKNKDRFYGTLIDKRYMLLHRIASGGMADVYEGMDTKLKRKVAIKILHEAYAGTRSFTARFEKEAQILSKLKSPNIISVYDYGEFEGLYFIVMEFINGRSLKQVIDSKGAFDPKTAASYAIQICNALEIAHNNNLIHRDIKPQNVLIDDKGDLKVTDFGIAKYTTIDTTRTINILGTAHYISPEQAQGKSLDNRTDIYSLGILMYEMLVSDVPFRGGSSIDISIRHINERPQPPSEIVKEIPVFLEYIVMKCIEKNPDNRYQDIRDLKKDLKSYIENKPALYQQSEISANKNIVFKKPVNLSYQTRDKNINGIKVFEYSRYKKILISLLALSVLFLALSFIFMTLFIITQNKLDQFRLDKNLVDVPQLVNTELKSAEKILSDSGLKIIVKSEVFNEQVPEGFIISQEPQNGETVLKNSEIEVYVSKGIESVFTDVPNLAGISLSDAEEMLASVGLKTGKVKEEYSDFLNKGMVLGQNPSPLAQVEYGSGVDLTVSKGRELVTIPDFKGYDYYFAKSNLEALGLNVYTKIKSELSLPPGTVTGTEPAEGSAVEKNTIVYLFISTNEGLITVPDLSGLDISIAQQRLAEINILYEINYIDVDYSIQKNAVISQFPQPSEQISQGDKIILFVGQLN
ncbi:MAG: Stk1 family PASTA domain-containing Ser/Thr kinase [Actinobacteria bacterium]|nr:Stk1 family PASTA domain-containing Ser/Thr kinase [Actinomycetota bacterium]